MNEQQKQRADADHKATEAAMARLRVIELGAAAERSAHYMIYGNRAVAERNLRAASAEAFRIAQEARS